MKEFLFEYGWVIALIVATLLYIVYAYKKHGKDVALEEARTLALKYMLAVDNILTKKGTITGPEKFRTVSNLVWSALPKSLKLVFGTQNKLEEEMQSLFDDAMDLLDDGVINKSTKSK